MCFYAFFSLHVLSASLAFCQADVTHLLTHSSDQIKLFKYSPEHYSMAARPTHIFCRK